MMLSMRFTCLRIMDTSSSFSGLPLSGGTGITLALEAKTRIIRLSRNTLSMTNRTGRADAVAIINQSTKLT